MTKPDDNHRLSRRDAIWRAGAGLAATAAAAVGLPLAAAEGTGDRPRAEAFRYCLNTGTIRGQNCPLMEEIRVAAQAGYNAIEPWLQEIADYVGQGGSPVELKKRVADLGLSVESVVGFTNWITDEADRGPGGFEQWKRDFELVASIGGKRICAPPGGMASKTSQDLFSVARRYRDCWSWAGRSAWCRRSSCGAALRRWPLGRSGPGDDRSRRCRGLHCRRMFSTSTRAGSDFAGLRMFNGATLHVFHMNDYPADPPRETITDAHRVYPGDGVAPLTAVLRDLRRHRFPRRAFARIVQPRVLETGAVERRTHGLGKDARLRGQSPGIA